jgi:hypothetical protein
MSTSLEKYLSEQRSGLDVEYPDDEMIWQGIRKKASQGKTRRNDGIFKLSRTKLWKVAAMVTIIFSFGYITLDIVQDQRMNRTGVLAKLNGSLGEQETEYIYAVSLKQKELKSIDIPKNEIINTLFEELKTQDDLFKEAVSDLDAMGNSDKLINTIFSIYERKIDLLERIIIETNKSHNYEKNSEVIL